MGWDLRHYFILIVQRNWSKTRSNNSLGLSLRYQSRLFVAERNPCRSQKNETVLRWFVSTK